MVSIISFDIIWRQHPSLTGPLDSASHPALVDRLTVDDQVSVQETHFIDVLSCIVVYCPKRSAHRTSHGTTTRNHLGLRCAFIITLINWVICCQTLFYFYLTILFNQASLTSTFLRGGGVFSFFNWGEGGGGKIVNL